MSYKVVFRASRSDGAGRALTWEAGCPLLFEAIQIARNVETGEAFLQAKLANITDGEIGSFRACLTVTHRDGSTESFDVEPLDADIAPGADYQITPLALKDGDALAATGRVLAVRTAAGSWKSSVEALPLPTPPVLDMAAEALEERRSALGRYPRFPAGACRFGLTVDEAWWLCPCGQPNVDTSACISCGTPLKALEVLEDEGRLLERVEKRKAAEAERAEKRKKERARRAKLAKRGALIGASLVAAIAAAALVMTLWGLPMLRYNNALAKADAGDFQTAYDALVELGDFNGAAAKAEEVAREAATAAENANDTRAAVSWYDELGETEKANEIRYAYALDHFDNQDPTTWAFLKQLRGAQYRDAEALSSQLYDWSFEFSLCSRQDYENAGEQWTEGGTLQDGDSAVLLVRATGGPTSEERTLLLDFEAIAKDGSGLWVTPFGDSLLDRTVTVKSDGSIAVVAAGSTLNWKAWRVTVKDPVRGETIATEEIHLAE